MGAKDCSRPPGSDIWAHFAGFLAELIAKDRGVYPNVETFYGDNNAYGSSAAYYIAEYLNIEQPTAYKRKNRALDRLTVLLFGKS